MSSNGQSFKSLREYIAEVEDRGELQQIDGADWDLEIGAITETVAHSDNPRALVFDDVEGYDAGYRVATNLFITTNLQALALGIDPSGRPVDLVDRWRQKMGNIDPIEPTVVSDGPVRENVLTGDDVDLLSFPVPKWHEEDGGRFFGTGDANITQEPDSDWQNMAVYRNMIHDAASLGILVVPTHQGWGQMEKYWEQGEDAPIVITAGQSPAVFAAACAPLPRGYSELDYAGGILGEGVEVIEHESGLPVPANAEIAVLGHVPSPEKETLVEGPFGECMGYYAGGEEAQPVIHVDELWHRSDPILQGNPTMTGSTAEHALGAELVSSARIWDSIDEEIPNVEGVFSVHQQCQKGVDFTAVSIEQAYAGHAKQAAVATLGTYANVTANNAVIVVDEDVDPSDTDDVLFAFMTRCDPAEDIDIVRGVPSDTLDPRIDPDRREAGDLTTSSMLIDACRPYHWRDEFPTVNRISDERQREMTDKWNLDDWQ